MTRNRKPVWRWIGEALLIFFSVLGAFYFENLRENRNELQDYLQSLRDFRSDLLENQAKFGHELNPKWDPATNQGYIPYRVSQYDTLHAGLASRSKTYFGPILQTIKAQEVVGPSPWIFTSLQHEILSRDYYAYIRNPNLKQQLEMHDRNNANRHEIKSMVTRQVEEFERTTDEMNLEAGYSPTNEAILFSNRSVNTMRRVRDEYVLLENFTRYSKERDSLLIIEVERELGEWGKAPEGR